MPRFHIHVINSIGITRDNEGQEFQDLDAAKNAAIEGVRSILSAEVMEGRIDLRGRTEIASPEDEVMSVIDFADIVHVLHDEIDP